MSINTDFQAEIARIFDKKSVSEISVDELDDLSARVFAETLGELNRVGEGGEDSNKAKEKIADTTDDEIKILEKVYYKHLKLLSEKIIETCTNDKSIIFWLELAKKCELNGNDFLGYAVNMAIKNPLLKRYIESSNKLENQYKLKSQYFDDLFMENEYLNRLQSRTESLVSPLLHSYFNIFNSGDISEIEYNAFKKLDESLKNKKPGMEMRSQDGSSETKLKNNQDKKLLTDTNQPTKQTKNIISVLKQNNSDNHIKLKTLFQQAKTYYRDRRKEIKKLFKSKLKGAGDNKLAVSNQAYGNTEPALKNPPNTRTQKEFAKSPRKEYLTRISERLFKKKQESKSFDQSSETDNKLNNNKKMK